MDPFHSPSKDNAAASKASLHTQTKRWWPRGDNNARRENQDDNHSSSKILQFG